MPGLPITGWWPDINVQFALSVPPSLTGKGAAVAAGMLGLSVPPTLGFTGAPTVAGAFTLSVPPSLGATTGTFPITFPHTFGQ